MRKYEELYTVLVEIEGVLNNRPLTYLEEDDIKEPLTPIHLYCSHRILNSIKGEGHESDSHCSNNRGQALSGKHHWIKYTNLSGSVGEKIIY